MKKVNQEESQATGQEPATAKERSLVRITKLTQMLHDTVQQFLKEEPELTTNELTNASLRLGIGYNKYQIEVDNENEDKDKGVTLESGINKN